MSKHGFKQVEPGEPIPIKLNSMVKMKCCNCGMVHEVTFSLEKKNLIMRAWFDKKSIRKLKN